MHFNLSKLQERVKDRETQHAAVHGVTKNHTRLSNWTEQNPCSRFYHLIFGNDSKIYCCPTFILSHSNQLSCADCFYSCDTTFIYCSITKLLLNLMAWNHSHFYSFLSHHSIEPLTGCDEDLHRFFVHNVFHIHPFLSLSPSFPNSSPITSSLKTTTASSLGLCLQLLCKTTLFPW